MSIVKLLDTPVPNEMVSTREGPGGRSLSYVTGSYVEQRLCEIFGPMCWDVDSSELQIAVKVRPWKMKNGDGFFAAYTCRSRLTVRHQGETAYRDGWGYGDAFDQNPGQAIESAIKEAETDSLKRAAKRLGKALGLSLYPETGKTTLGGRSGSPSKSAPGAPGQPLKFGKHKGVPLAEIPTGYLKWLAKSLAGKVQDSSNKYRDRDAATLRDVQAVLIEHAATRDPEPPERDTHADGDFSGDDYGPAEGDYEGADDDIPF